ncbi:hypothetical protein GCM10027614_74710 [Micromonospora vulcania]
MNRTRCTAPPSFRHRDPYARQAATNWSLYASIRSRTAARRALSAGAVEVALASSAGHTPRRQARVARASLCPTSQSRYRSGMLTTSTRAFGRPVRRARRPRSTSARNVATGVIASTPPRQTSLAPISTVT